MWYITIQRQTERKITTTTTKNKRKSISINYLKKKNNYIIYIKITTKKQFIYKEKRGR